MDKLILNIVGAVLIGLAFVIISALMETITLPLFETILYALSAMGIAAVGALCILWNVEVPTFEEEEEEN